MATHKHSNTYRQEGNRRTVDLVISGKMDALYATVIKHLGGDRVRISIGKKEGIAVIRGALRSRGKVPIYANDTVVVLPRNEDASYFDLIGVLNAKQASDVVKNETVETKDEAFEFDYLMV
jgi:translation initiation factor IF-1